MRPLDEEPGPGIPVVPGGGTGGGGGGTGSPGGNNSPGAIGTTIHDVTVPKADPDSLLRCLTYLHCASNDDLQLLGYIIVNGVVRQTFPYNLPLDNQQSRARAGLCWPAYVAGLPVGPTRIVVSVLNKEPDSPLTVYAASTLEVTELRKPSL